MEVENGIVNRVASSSLVVIDLEDYYSPNPRVVIDLKDCLFQELILRESDFRQFISSHDWGQYKGCNVAITCSIDAIIPAWAYMLVTSRLVPFVNYCIVGGLEDLERSLFQLALSNFDSQKYIGAKVVVKGCGSVPVPMYAFGELVRRLVGVSGSVVYGEPCSTVPVYRGVK